MLLATLTLRGVRSEQCPDSLWVTLESSRNCYKLVDEYKTWDAASNHCVSLGGHLLTLETEQEANELSEYLESTDYGG